MRSRPKPAEPGMPNDVVFQIMRPVVDVEVSLLAAPGANLDWTRPEIRDNAISVAMNHTDKLFEPEMYGRVSHVAHSTFNHHGMTVHLTVEAPDNERTQYVIETKLPSLERSLETKLQVHFKWEQAAVSVQMETHPDYQVRMGQGRTAVGHAKDVMVYQPPGGSNAIAPVIVTIPTTSHEATSVIGADYLPQRRERSSVTAALFGALVVIGLVIFVALAIGPLTERIAAMDFAYDRARANYSSQIALRDQRITTLSNENQNLRRTVSNLSSRRGRPAARWEQPPRALPDTDALGPGPIAATAVTSAPSPAAGAP
jgi:hypothetical protein